MYLWASVHGGTRLRTSGFHGPTRSGGRKLNVRGSSIGMEVNDVVRRVGLAYWPLILGLACVGAMVGGILHYHEPAIYTSDVRFVLDTPDPRAAAESTSIADTAKSIATSPSHIAAALALAGVSRDINEFATRNVELLPLGTSGVMDLQVKDTDSVAASVIANALVADILSTRSAVGDSQANDLIASLTDEINTLGTNIAKLDGQIAHYRPTSNDPSISAAALSGLYSERASLAQERLSLEQEKYQINQSMALRPHAGIIDPAVPASKPDPSRAPIDMALGGLGGLVLAVMLAALLATLRPRIAGQGAIERMLEAPVLGDFDPLDENLDTTLGTRVRIAAIRAGVKHVQLVAIDGSAEALGLVSILAEKLGSRRPPDSVPVPLNGNGQAVARPRRKSSHHDDIDVTPFDLSVFSKNGYTTETGLILVTPDVLHRTNLDASTDLVSLTGWPVAGVVTYGRKLHRIIGLELHGRRSELRLLRADRDRLNRHGSVQGLK
jgi:hypothetical protein